MDQQRLVSNKQLYFPLAEKYVTLLKTTVKQQFGIMGVCEDLVICGVKNPESVPDETMLKARGTFSGRVKNLDHYYYKRTLDPIKGPNIRI